MMLSPGWWVLPISRAPWGASAPDVFFGGPTITGAQVQHAVCMYFGKHAKISVSGRIWPLLLWTPH